MQDYLRQSEMIQQDQQQEIMLLREILTSRNIPFEKELKQRKASQGSIHGQLNTNMNNQYSAPPFSHMLTNTSPSSGFTDLPQTGFSNGSRNYSSGQSPGQSGGGPSPQGYHHHSNNSPGLDEFRPIKQEAVSDMPGIFEKDPQLGIDFILA